MKILKHHFAINCKPGKDEMKKLMKETKCSYNEVCRWFRNERHKEKKVREGKQTTQQHTGSSKDDAEGAQQQQQGAALTPPLSPAVPPSPSSSASLSVPSSPLASNSSLTISTSQPAAPACSASSVDRLSEWLHTFSSEFSCDMQSLALKELILRTKSIAAQGSELERLFTAGGKKRERVEEVEKRKVEADCGEDKRRKME